MNAPLRCERTDLPVFMCAHCRGEDLPKPDPLRWFTVRFPGACVACGHPIEPGDEIAATPDGYVCCERGRDA